MARKVIIIGSGPAGHTAAIYAARADLEPLMYEGFMAGGVAAGGQLTTTTEVENFPGFPDGIDGQELCSLLRKQSEKYGTEIRTETIYEVDLSKRPFKVKATQDMDLDGEVSISSEEEAATLIIATGAIARRMHLPGEDRLWGAGVSACAVCDGALPIYRDKVLAVIGGGDAAVEEASFLTKFASKVLLIHRRDALRASKVMQERALAHPKIEIVWDTVAEDALGEKIIEGIRVKNVKTGEVRDIPVGGLFYAIGHKPNTDFLKGQLELDEADYIITRPNVMATNVAGVFAAGDVQDKAYRQAITAAGTGCMAALEAEHFDAHNPLWGIL